VKKNPLYWIDYIKKVGGEALLYRVMPNFLMELAHKYFRLEIEGLENIPKNGAAIIAPNHSGYAGFDAMLLTHEIFKRIHRVPRVLTHKLWFLTKYTSIPANKMGYIEATTENGLKELGRGQLIILFPEGENGNFKSTKNAYKLQEFKRGFIRMSLNSRAPIIPTLIIGAEETHINLKQLKFGKFLPGISIPLPFNLLPLPVKWKIKFLDPIYPDLPSSSVCDSVLMRKLANEIQEKMQEAINRELLNREGIFIHRPPWLNEFIKKNIGNI